jgi:hypothetical protein
LSFLVAASRVWAATKKSCHSDLCRISRKIKHALALLVVLLFFFRKPKIGLVLATSLPAHHPTVRVTDGRMSIGVRVCPSFWTATDITSSKCHSAFCHGSY